MSADAAELADALLEMSTGSRARLVCDVFESADPDKVATVSAAVHALPDGEAVMSWLDAIGEARRRRDPDLEADVGAAARPR